MKNKARTKKPVSKSKVVLIIFCCTGPLLHWLIFYVYGNIASFPMAFTDMNGNISFNNFVRVWHEITHPASELATGLKNTFITFGLQTIWFPFGVLVSYFIYKKVPGAAVYRILFFLPTIIFPVAMNLIVTKLLSVNGFIAQAVQDYLNLPYTPELLADSRFANTTVMIHMMWIIFPGSLILWGGSFARIPEEVLESARIDGVTWWQEFTLIILPLIWPMVALQLVLRFATVLSVTNSNFLLTGGQFGTMTLPTWQHLQMLGGTGAQGNSNLLNYMSAVGWCMTIVAVTLAKIVQKLTDRFEEVEY